MYDYRLDDAGISNPEDAVEDEERQVKLYYYCTKFQRKHSLHLVLYLVIIVLACTVGPVG